MRVVADAVQLTPSRAKAAPLPFAIVLRWRPRFDLWCWSVEMMHELALLRGPKDGRWDGWSRK